MSKIKMVCHTCGNENVLRDAYAEWDVAKQDWVLQNVFDDAVCEDCGGETHINEVPIDEESEEMSDHSDETHRDDACPSGEVHATGCGSPGDCGDETEARITATQVPEKDRTMFLPRETDGENLSFEFGVYDMARKFSPDYGGGLWNFYKLSNGGFYIAPDDADKRFRLSVETNGYVGECSADALGIICSLYSLNTLLWRQPTEFFNMKYYALYDYAAQHPEAATIFGAID